MSPTLRRRPAFLALALRAATISPAAGQESVDTIYTGSLHGTALNISPTSVGTGWGVDLGHGLLVTNEHVVTSHALVEEIFPLWGKDGKPVAEPSKYRKDAPRIVADVINADAGLLRDGTPLVARRMQIWADNPQTKAVWNAAKDRNTWLAPANGYRSGPKPEQFTFTFNP